MSTTLLDLVINVMSMGEKGPCLPTPRCEGDTIVMPIYNPDAYRKPAQGFSRREAEASIQTIRLQWMKFEDGRAGWCIVTPILLTALPSDEVYSRRAPF